MQHTAGRHREGGEKKEMSLGDAISPPHFKGLSSLHLQFGEVILLMIGKL